MLTGTLSASQLSKSFGPALVVDDVSLSIPAGARLGLVGPNGSGKSTLLRMLAGIERPDDGHVRRAPGDLAVGYIPQELAATGSSYDAIAARTGVAEAEAHVDALAARLDEETLGAYEDALERFTLLGGGDLRVRAEGELADLGLEPRRLDDDVSTLSPGQAARVALAGIRLARFGVFLLDEPTNNLDFAGIDKLEQFLTSLDAGFLVISHDRAFLDRVVDRVIEMDGHTHRTTEFAGAWSEYVERRELARTQGYAAHGKYVAERGRLTQRLHTQRTWAEKGAAKLSKRPRDADKFAKGFFMNRTEKQASKVRTTEKAIERLDVVDKPWEGWRLQMELKASGRAGDIVARLQDAVIERGTFSLGPLSVEVNWGDRVAILGPNGAGKTTLLSAILGRTPLAQGRRYLGPGVTVGELTQARDAFAVEATALDVFVERSAMAAGEARTLLAKYGLGPDALVRPANALSPGERTRAILALLVALEANCLVLDEPTNHLDVEAIEQLEQALDTYDGTLLMVTHDRWLLDAVEVTKTIELEVDGTVRLA